MCNPANNCLLWRILRNRTSISWKKRHPIMDISSMSKTLTEVHCICRLVVIFDPLRRDSSWWMVDPLMTEAAAPVKAPQRNAFGWFVTRNNVCNARIMNDLPVPPGPCTIALYMPLEGSLIWAVSSIMTRACSETFLETFPAKKPEKVTIRCWRTLDVNK